MSGAGRARLPGSVSAARLPWGSAFLPSEMGGVRTERRKGGVSSGHGLGTACGCWKNQLLLKLATGFMLNFLLPISLLLSGKRTQRPVERLVLCDASQEHSGVGGALPGGSAALGTDCVNLTALRQRGAKEGSSQPLGVGQLRCCAGSGVGGRFPSASN